MLLKNGDISLSPVYNEALASVYEEAYIAGAKEQKAIDEEVRLKKCDDTKEEAEMGRKDSNYISTAKIEWEE